MSPKLSDKCHHKRKAKGDLREREGHVKSEAKIGVWHPKAKEHLELLEAGRGKEGLSPKTFGETVGANTLISGLQNCEQE